VHGDGPERHTGSVRPARSPCLCQTSPVPCRA
jgi:hypothetical protein